MPNALAGAWVQMCPVSPYVLAHGVGGGCPRVEMRYVAYGMKELPIGKKRPQQKQPRPLYEPRSPPQGGQQKPEIQQDQCVGDFHGVKAYRSPGLGPPWLHQGRTSPMLAPLPSQGA